MSLSTKMSYIRANESFLSQGRRRSTLQSANTIFSKADLDEFCPTELYEIILANELTPECVELQNGIIEASKKDENPPNVVFITQDEIYEFIKAVDKNELHNFWHPSQHIANLKELCSEYVELSEENEGYDDVGIENFARILKHYVINKMCTPRIKAAEFEKKMSKLNETLKKLQTNKIISANVKKKKPKRKKTKKKIESQENEDLLQDLPSKLPNDSDDLKDHIFFYILIGFKDPIFLKILPRHKVPINCILQISSKEYVSRTELDDFWRKIDEMSKRVHKHKLTEDMIHMKYVYNSQIPEEDQEDFFKQRLTELYDILMEIPELKRKHFHYIRHLYPFDFNEGQFRYGPFPMYEANMQKIPIEFVTIPYIVKSMVDEVENYSVSSEIEKCRQNEFDKVCKIKCELYQRNNEVDKVKNDKTEFEKQRCPFKFNKFLTPHILLKPKSIEERRTLTQKFHEGDQLNILISAKKHMENMVLSDFDILSKQKVLQLRKACEDSLFCNHQDDICILRKDFIPKMKKPIFTKEQTNHFLHLLFLSNMKISEDTFRRKKIYSKYLCTGEEVFEHLTFLPDSNMLVSCENLFQKFYAMQHRWIEPLPNTVLIQRLFECQKEFSNFHFHYCYQTNTFLVYFHNNLTASGTRSRVWRESLRTLTCLRDFCSFYIFEDAEWLSKHPPKKQIKYEEYKQNEDARFFQRMIESDNRYREYKKYLAPFRYCGDTDCQGNLTCLVEECEKTGKYAPIEGLYPNLSEIMTEIKTHPTGYDLKKTCAKDREPDTLLSYDRRPQRFGLTGSTHEFFSHDGVKITIDTCRFHSEDFKLNFSMEFDSNVLFGHFRRHDVNVHLALADGTIVKFGNLKSNVQPKSSSCSEIEVNERLGLFLTVAGESIYDMYWNDLIHAPDDVTRTEERKMLSIYEDKDFVPLEDSARKVPERESKKTYTNILKRLVPSNEAYKVAFHKSNNLSAKLKKKYVSYSSIIRRVLKDNVEDKEMPVYHRKVLLKGYDQSRYQKDDLSVKVTLPNGLMVEALPSTTNNDDIIIKQMHSEAGKNSSVSDEDYRLFFENGMILIRFSSGNMRIMDAQGIIVELREKPIKSKFDLDNKKCFRDIEMCRKQLYLINKNSKSKKHKIDSYKRSRRSHLNFSIKLNMQHFNILDKFKLPFSKVDLITLDGGIYKIREDTVKKNKVARYLDSHDFINHELFRQRTDNMKSLYKNNGSVIFVFPDGTKITKSMVVDTKLSFFNKRDKEGWVIVSNIYLYEHPSYLPIEFKNGPRLANPRLALIYLKDNVKLELASNNCDIEFNEQSFIQLDPESINFKKVCLKCGSSCTCDIDILPKDFKKTTEKFEPFLIMKDSYDKQFESDSQGRCKVNTDFIKGELNNLQCNHYLNNDYQKVFLIHGDLSGDLLWNDKMVVREIDKIKQEIKKDPLAATFEEFTTVDKSMTSFKFIRNKYVEFKDKYLSPRYMFPMVFMKTSDYDINPLPSYQVSKSIFNIIQEKDIRDLRDIFKKLFKD
ncbi:hypothetical protein WA026_012114 [Henosepilachna vigintioctopunctata]|uniref:Uncharacterized protein n=1 Tax=Henosepilachna vigintioctopunctata TaxID=420089 RepID=A0AAW1VCA3_9CUCU